MDIFLVIIAGVLMLIGLAGALIPVLPGPPLSYAGILLLHFSKYGSFSTRFLLLWAVLTIAVTVLDYLVPIWGAKKFGGTKAGIRGSTIGLLIGLFFFPPIGLIVGPFAGAFIGDLIAGKKGGEALKSAFGSFVGFLIGTGLKLVLSALMLYYFVTTLYQYINA